MHRRLLLRPGRLWAGVRPGLAAVGVATLVSAACTWLLQAAAGRLLSARGFVEFMAVWGLFFAMLGLLQGLQQETTRCVSAARSRSPVMAAGRPVTGAVAIGLVGVALLLVANALGTADLFGGGLGPVELPLATAIMVYAVFNVVGGGLAGRSEWSAYARLILLEGLLRAVLVLVVLLRSQGSVAAVGWALAGGGLAAAVVVAPSRLRPALTGFGDASLLRFLAGSAQAMVASGCSALCIAGFPFLLAVTARGTLPGSAAALIAAVVATRAPLLITLNAYQGAAITRFVAEAESALRHLVRLGVRVALLVALGSVLSFFIGPWLLRALYGPGFVADGTLFACLVLSAGLMSLLMLTGSASVAASLHGVFAAGWVVAAAGTGLCLSLGLPLDVRATLALLVGPFSGLLVHAFGLFRWSRGSRGHPSVADVTQR